MRRTSLSLTRKNSPWAADKTDAAGKDAAGKKLYIYARYEKKGSEKCYAKACKNRAETAPGETT